MMLWRHDLGDVPHHGLIRATGLKGLGTFTGFGTCSRFRWASVVGRAFSRAMPASGGGLATTRPHAWRRTRRRWGSTYPYLRRGSRVKQNLKRKPRSHVVGNENGAQKGNRRAAVFATAFLSSHLQRLVRRQFASIGHVISIIRVAMLFLSRPYSLLLRIRSWTKKSSLPSK